MTISWRIAAGADPALFTWGDEYVVHHALSNNTHRLSATAGRLLLQLGAGVEAGRADGGRVLKCDEDEAVAVLEALCELGLVSRC